MILEKEIRTCQSRAGLVSMGEPAQLTPSSSFYVVTTAIMGCKSFKIGSNFWIILPKSYKSKDPTSFLD